MRSAGLVINDNKILVAKNDNYDCFYIVGGSVNQGENTKDALLRELREETDIRFEIDRLVFAQERFYSLNEICRHEIVFFYLLKHCAIEIQAGANTDQKCEHLYWLPVDELDKVNIVPTFLKNSIEKYPK